MNIRNLLWSLQTSVSAKCGHSSFLPGHRAVKKRRSPEIPDAIAWQAEEAMAKSRHPYLDWEGPIPFAHRGGTSEYPENTMPAFEHAVSLGYRYLETDVHVTADGVLVAFHDTDLARTCGHAGEIIDMTWAELAVLRVDGREPIPLMRDLLERWPDVRFNIDCKAESATEPLAQLIESTGAIDRVCVAAFGHGRLNRLRQRLGPRLLTALSPQEIGSLRLIGWVAGSRAHAAQVPTSAGRPSGRGRLDIVTPSFIRRAHQRGVPVHVSTIDDETEMHRLLDLGVDGIMTDRPEVLRDVLDSRGVWRD
jgi:glycerophosphoryl diester phosphodiesterase